MKILVAVDKSEESQQALRYTCHLLEHFTAIVDALYVQPDVVEAAAVSLFLPSVFSVVVDSAFLWSLSDLWKLPWPEGER